MPVCRTQREINYLLKKYKNKQPGEIFVTDNMKKEYGMQEWRINQKIRKADYIMDRLSLQGTQRQRVKYLVRKLDFNNLCRNCSNETIIVALAYYVKRTSNSNIKLSDYKICVEHNLTDKVLSTIIMNLCDELQRNQVMGLY